MAQSKKFGTFGGVFTPSVLTILGVIMYLRLPWIIAQGGLFYTLAIIVVAHIVSITTGLSVSSIATDKKVEAGGNYYIISRSLGLPIGGTLGIALFVGLSFSISLYIIGFCESLLSVLEIPLEISAIRLYGSITLVLLTILIFISTSLAIKLQYFILGAVLLSLVSVFMGGMDLQQSQFVLNRAEEGVDLFVLFGIFFPAVTGFTAGVQMSGDLKDPKKSIPFGTMAAIAVGFLVYIGLAIFIALKIDASSLAADPNILASISWMPQLVVAGIWGATISSALGSILGAPRILQATSVDKVTPKFFEKGTGASNEPRRALIFTFIIAEAGILIGELNIIARIVSIFFISTYGLINLSYAIEVWASTDFRPSFKVPMWVGIVGAVAAAIIMFELDVLAFVAATLVLGALYLYLKKKELTLETGDTWGSFWSSVVRSGLHRLNESAIHKRNWRPNILLFRGAENSREYLLDFGKWLTGKSGIISDFELIESPDETIRISKAAQHVKGEEQVNDGIFKRRYECRDLYTGIESIAQFYGFSGVEPNTVILGWPKNTHRPERVVQLLQKLKSLDYNVLLLNRGREKSFGAYATIDLWWRGGSNNAALALTLMRFMHSAEIWARAKFRIFIIVDDSALINKIHKNMDHLLDELRQEAEIRIINNAIEKRSFKEIMKVESAATDLTILGMPALENNPDFIKNTSTFIQDFNTVLLLNASSFFEPYFIGIEKTIDSKTKSDIKKVQAAIAELKLPRDEVLAKRLKAVYMAVNNAIEEFFSGYLSEAEQDFIELGGQIKSVAESNLLLVDKKIRSSNPVRMARLLAHIQSDILYNAQRLLHSFQKEKLKGFGDNLASGLDIFLNHLTEILENNQSPQTIYFKPKDLAFNYSDPFPVKLLKAKKLTRNRFLKTEIKINAKVPVLLNFYLNGFLRKAFYKQFGQIGVAGYGVVSGLQKTLARLFDITKNLELSLNKEGKLSEEQVAFSQKEMALLFDDFENKIRDDFKNELLGFLSLNKKVFQSMIAHFDKININYVINKKYTLKKQAFGAEKFLGLPAKWAENLNLMFGFAGMELVLEEFKNRFKTIMRKWTNDLKMTVYSEITGHLKKISKVFDETQAAANDKNSLSILELGSMPLRKIEINFSPVAKEVQNIMAELPETIDVMSEQSFQNLDTAQFEEQEVVSVYLRRLIGYLIDTEFFSDLNEKVAQFNQELQNLFMRIDDVQSLLASGLAETETESELDLPEETDIDFIIQNGTERLAEIGSGFEESFNGLLHYVNERMHTAFDKMNPYLMTHTTNKLKQYIFSHEQKKVLSRIESFRRDATKFFQKMAVNLKYSQSAGILFAQKLNKLETNKLSIIDRLISLTDTLSPQQEVFKNIPRYYKQLFIGEHSISRQFLISRPAAFAEAERIISHYRQGYRGAMLITGGPASGKTTLSRMIASRYVEKQKTYRIDAPAGGSVDVNTFMQRISEATHKKGNLEEIFSQLPQKSAIIINDLEMWWQRTENGFQVIDTLLGLIDRFSHKTLFIININNYAFKLINTIHTIEDAFVGIISDEAFNTKEIQKAILQRHRSTGIKFEYESLGEDKISDFRMAGLFNTVFNFSNGSIGVALKTWLVMIKAYNADKVNLKNVEKPMLRTLEDLPKQWLVWLTTIILHKELTHARLIEILEGDAASVDRMVEALQRSGLVVGQNGVLKINIYLEHLLSDKLIEMGLLWSN